MESFNRSMSLMMLIFLLPFAAQSQVDVNRFQNIISSVADGGTTSGAGFKGRYNADGKIKGDPYLDSAFIDTKYSFFRAHSYFSGPSRFDILNDEFEVKTTAGIRVIKSALVKGYTIVEDGDSVNFIKAGQFNYDGTELAGYFQVLSEGKIPLVKHTRIEIIKPSYNPSLEVGDRNSHLVKKQELYLVVDGNVKKVKGKKEILNAFGANADKVTAFMQSERLGTKNEKDLVRIFKYYNSLH